MNDQGITPEREIAGLKVQRDEMLKRLNVDSFCELIYRPQGFEGHVWYGSVIGPDEPPEGEPCFCGKARYHSQNRDRETP